MAHYWQKTVRVSQQPSSGLRMVPQACYRVILDDGKRSMVERDIPLFKTDTEAINWLALEADRCGLTRWQCTQE